MNEDINLRIKFIQEIERHPYLYDHNHVLYNHRDKIEAAWKKIGQIFGEDSDNCKKKWRLIRCSYTRSLKLSKQKTSLGVGLAKGYYMAPHLKFLDPFLKSRSYQENNLSEEEEETVENIDSNSMVHVTLEHVKVEIEDDEEYEDPMADENTSQESLVKKRSFAGEDATSKRMKIQKERKKDLSTNEMYLLSLAPYFENMTERQKLTFQKGVIQLIEDIKYGS